MVRTWWHELFSQGQSGVQRGDRRARVRQRRMQKPWLESLEERCLLSYSVTDLGTLPGTDDSAAYAINDSGMVVGESGTMAFGSQHAFLWDAASGMQDLGTLGGPAGSAAYGINSKGSVVGEASSPDGYQHAFLYDGGPLIDLGTLGDTVSWATGVNDAGQVVGFSVTTFGFRPFLWDAEHGMQDLGTLGGDYAHAEGINASGTVVGFSGSPMRAFLWDAEHGMQDLGTLGGDISRAEAINSQAHIVGFARRADGYDVAFFYDGNQMIDIGQPSPSMSTAFAINDSDQIVGDIRVQGPILSHGFIYADGEMQDLNDLIPPDSGLIVTEARGINNAGQIAAVAVDVFNHTHAVLLAPDSSPIPAPAGRMHFTSSDVQAVLLAGSTVTAADAGVPPFSLTLATRGEQTLPGTDTAEATPIGRATVPGTSDAAAPAGRTVPNATDAVFARSHPANASVAASDWEVTELERGVSLLPTL